MDTTKFDIIVIGGGHAGIEAAHIAAKMGAKTLLITIDKHNIGTMPCNPSIGGLGKGHIVFEVSALGGLMPKLCSHTHLQARMLNTRKGPAVQGLRLQIDKYAYQKHAQNALEHIQNLTIHQNTAAQILTKDGNVTGVVCTNGAQYTCDALIITSGTYLQGTIHIGLTSKPGGTDESPAATDLSQSIEQTLGVTLGRLKTGTPPRLLRSSIDFTKLERQASHTLKTLFEFRPVASQEKTPCFIAHTNKTTHEIIKQNLHESALFGGAIQGVGPRYCPSIEDKIARFPDRDTHHVFIEPEGGDDTQIYPGGLSTSLPAHVQQAYINSIIGLEQAIITKPGYAIEYDFLQPNNLTHTLEAKACKGLFFAGQINGTTGYEEAAGQGIIAGINAALQIQKKDPFILTRTESYIGVMIDDIVTLGVNEPYRMFTSRAERRLILRQDNVFLRLMPYAHKLGTVSQETYNDFLQEKAYIETTIEKAKTDKNLHRMFYTQSHEYVSPHDRVSHDRVPYEYVSPRALLCIHAHIKYSGYIEKEEKEARKLEMFQALSIPATFTYTNMPGLTTELREKLTHHKPQTIAQAQLIPGMTPAALSILIFQIKSLQKRNHQC